MQADEGRMRAAAPRSAGAAGDGPAAEALARIAEALARLAPPPDPPLPDPLPPVLAFEDGRLRPVAAPEPPPLSLFRGVEAQKRALAANLAALAAGRPAHDMLLWGARGCGKSALVRSTARARGLPLVEVPGHAIARLGALFDRLAAVAQPVLVFLDDLAFAPAADGGRELRLLRALLDGGVRARPPKVRLAVTSNHRHLVVRGPGDGEARHARDAAEDALALVDRFGLVLGFHPPDEATFLEMCRAHCEAAGLPLDPDDARAFALARGGRSGRTAFHYRVELSVRAAAGSDPLASESGLQ